MTRRQSGHVHVPLSPSCRQDLRAPLALERLGFLFFSLLSSAGGPAGAGGFPAGEFGRLDSDASADAAVSAPVAFGAPSSDGFFVGLRRLERLLEVDDDVMPTCNQGKNELIMEKKYSGQPNQIEGHAT